MWDETEKQYFTWLSPHTPLHRRRRRATWARRCQFEAVTCVVKNNNNDLKIYLYVLNIYYFTIQTECVFNEISYIATKAKLCLATSIQSNNDYCELGIKLEVLLCLSLVTLRFVIILYANARWRRMFRIELNSHL